MPDPSFELRTERLLLRPWQTEDADDFAAMNAEEDVMADLGGPLTRQQSDAKLDRYKRSLELDGITRWVVATPSGRFLGYCGCVQQTDEHPLGNHIDIGWRLTRSAWGNGYATEAAKGAIDDAFAQTTCSEILAYTASGNLRSQAVMRKLGLERQPHRDFRAHYPDVGPWHGLVWAAHRPSALHPLPTTSRRAHQE